MWFVEKPNFSLKEVFEHFIEKSGKIGFQKKCKILKSINRSFIH